MSESPVHEKFGLTYASWLVWPRTVMQAMPVEWQERFCKLADEMAEQFPDWTPDGTFQVSLKQGGKFVKLPPELCNYRHPIKEYRAVIYKCIHCKDELCYGTLICNGRKCDGIPF